MPASALAASPRRFVRLLGLNSSRWPRGISEDRLLSDHIIPTAELDPLPVGARRSAGFRDDPRHHRAPGRPVARATRQRRPAARPQPAARRARPRRSISGATRCRDHAFSETDRLMARPQEFRAIRKRSARRQPAGATGMREEITPHDGLVRADHPLVARHPRRAPSRPARFAALLRNPLGFVWRLWPAAGARPKAATNRWCSMRSAMGDLVHMILDRALARPRSDRRTGDRRRANRSQRRRRRRRASVAADWESERAVPPARHLATHARRRASLRRPRAHLSATSVCPAPAPMAKCRSAAPSPSPRRHRPGIARRQRRNSRHRLPDRRLYRSARHLRRRPPRACARLQDRPTAARTPSCSTAARELQRCLYAFAVKALLGDDVTISASLLYPARAGRSAARRSRRRRSRRSPAISARRAPVSCRRRCAAGPTPAATMTTSPSRCRPTPAPPIANARCRRDRAPRRRRAGLGGPNDEQRVRSRSRMTARAATRSAVHDRSILVEAGAGSGKTAVMAGRIAVMLAEGIAPKTIAAVTFTELAASELLIACPRICRRPRGRPHPGRAARGVARRPVRCAARQSRRRERRDRRNHLLDHPRLLPAPDQALSGRGRHRSRAPS